MPSSSGIYTRPLKREQHQASLPTCRREANLQRSRPKGKGTNRYSQHREPAPALSPKRILFQHTFQIPKRAGKEPKAAPRANNSTDRKRRSDGKRKEEKLTRKPPQPDRSDRTPVPVQKISQPLPESGTETTTLTSRQEYERLRRQRPERRENAMKTARERRQRAKELGLCRDSHCLNKMLPENW